MSNNWIWIIIGVTFISILSRSKVLYVSVVKSEKHGLFFHSRQKISTKIILYLRIVSNEHSFENVKAA